MSTVPKSPAEKRAMKAARQKRYRDNLRARQMRETATGHIEYALGATDKPPRRPMPTVKRRDLAELVAAIAYDGVEDGTLDLTNKDHVPGITAGLRAQVILDSREKLKAKTGQTLELLSGLRAILSGDIAPPRQLEDGNTFEGEAVEVDVD